MLTALVAAGYDRDFATLDAGPAAAPDKPGAAGGHDAGPAPGCRGIVIDPIVGAVTLPSGVELDLGGIGKGLAADLVVDELLAAGAAGACVNVGGDLRARRAPHPAPTVG